VYRHVDALSERLCGGLKKLAGEHTVRVAITGVKSMFQLHFGVGHLANLRDQQGEDRARATEFSHGMLTRGIYAIPRPWFMSAAHTEEDMDTVLDAAEEVFKEVRRAHPAAVGDPA